MSDLVRPLGVVVDEHREWATGGNPRVPIGYSFFDSRTNGGIGTGEVAMFLAKSGVGKTIFACNVAYNAYPVSTVFFSLEMQARYILQRIAAIASNQPTDVVERLAMQGDFSLMEQTAEIFSGLKIVDKPGLTLKGMSEALDEINQADGQPVKMIIIDYLELIGGKGMSAGEKIDSISRNLKNFARSHDVAVLVLHQVNVASGRRGGTSRDEDDQGHLPLTRRSARFGGDTAADYVLSAYRPNLNPELPAPGAIDDFRLQFLKTRGSGGEVHNGVKHFLDTRSLRLTETDPQ